ncbi:MAG TPA: alkaline phosphatase family protein [Thermoplasmata archaeon]|nr:alkaline phosphatase family protein [Thermoplasmata archaeon]
MSPTGRAPEWDRTQLLPDYNGRGLSALAPTVSGWFGVPLPDSPTLEQDVLPSSLFEGAERVVILLVDGLGMPRLERQLATDPSLKLRDRVKSAGGAWSTITSVAPSTTTAALATVCTGLPPGEHGILGYRMLLPDMGRVANMIQFVDVRDGSPIGVPPESMLDSPTIFDRFRRTGVEAHVITRSDYLGSDLSRMLHAGAEMHGYEGLGEMAARLKRLTTRPGKRFVFCYWDLVDVISHGRGSNSPEVDEEIALLDLALSRAMAKGDGRTLLIVTADHGHSDWSPRAETYVDEIPPLAKTLPIPVGGDSRFLYLYTDDVNETRKMAEKHLSSAAAILPRDRAIKEGLFGPRGVRGEYTGRIGDLVVVPAGNHSYRQSRPVGGHTMLGRHGGLSAEEMLVPLIAVRI